MNLPTQKIRPAFVQTSILDELALKSLPKTLATEHYCYFLKWVDQTDFDITIPEKISLKGQFFTSDTEIRWKKVNDSYQVLFLSTKDYQLEKFQPLEGSWSYEDRKAIVHSETETRFPKVINVKGVNIGQRYFIDNTTSTIHFIALRRI